MQTLTACSSNGHAEHKQTCNSATEAGSSISNYNKSEDDGTAACYAQYWDWMVLLPMQTAQGIASAYPC